MRENLLTQIFSPGNCSKIPSSFKILEKFLPWVKGPDFLQKVEDERPCDSKEIPISVVSTCMLKRKTEVKPVRNLLLMLVKYYSNYDRLIRVFCFLFVSFPLQKIKLKF